MNYLLSDILESVRVTLDQNQVEKDLSIEYDQSTLELDDLIRQKVLEAALELLLYSPLEMVDNPVPLDASDVSRSGDGAFRIPLPEDWLRLHTARVSDWKRPVRLTHEEGSPELSVLESEFSGIHPNVYRPLAVVERDGAQPYLSLYGGGVGSHVETLLYVSRPSVKGGVLDFPELLYPSLIYLISSLVAASLKDPSSSVLRSLAMSYLGNTQDPKPQKAS